MGRHWSINLVYRQETNRQTFPSTHNAPLSPTVNLPVSRTGELLTLTFFFFCFPHPHPHPTPPPGGGGWVVEDECVGSHWVSITGRPSHKGQILFEIFSLFFKVFISFESFIDYWSLTNSDVLRLVFFKYDGCDQLKNPSAQPRISKNQARERAN